MTHVLSTNPCRFHEILKNLTDSDEGKLHILKVVYEVWRNHPQVRTTHKRFCRSAFGSAWMFGKMELKVSLLFTDDRSAGGQNDPDADRGLRRRC